RARVVVNRHSGKIHSYTPAETKNAQEIWQLALRSHLRSRPPDATHAFTTKLRFFARRYQKTDLDNLVKLVWDACTGLVWSDDRQVVGLDAWLTHGSEAPRTELEVFIVDQEIRARANCENCDKRFETRDGQRFCSRRCSDTFKRGQHLAPASSPACSGPIRIKEYIAQLPRASGQIACSRECANRVQSLFRPGRRLRRPIPVVPRGSNGVRLDRTEPLAVEF